MEKELNQEDGKIKIFEDNLGIHNRKFIIDGTFSTKRKNPKRKVKTNKKLQKLIEESCQSRKKDVEIFLHF